MPPCRLSILLLPLALCGFNSLVAGQGYIELNPKNTITPNAGTYYVGCYDSNGWLLPSCCPYAAQGVYTYSGGH